jgi:hypothetical protein
MDKLIRVKLREILNENIEFLLDKESDEYHHLKDDYGLKDINKVHSDIIKYSKEALEKFKEKVDLFDDIKIIFVNKIGDGALGRFRSGTSSSIPIVLMSEKDILKGSKKYDVPLWVAVETTIFHELGHAICELEYNVFGYEYLEYGDEEEWVENFAYELHNYDDIPQDLENFIQAYKESN